MKHKSDKLSALKFIPKPIDSKDVNEKIEENLKIFKGSELYSTLEKIYYEVEKSGKISCDLEGAARENDYDEHTYGNGYWSLICNQTAALKNVLKICKQLSKKRDKILFKKKVYIK